MHDQISGGRALPRQAALKIEIMFDGVRYSQALGDAVAHAHPNFAPYRFAEGEDNPTGQPTARIPYMMVLEDETHIRIQGNSAAPWQISGSLDAGYTLHHDDGRAMPVSFEPLPNWMRATASDGTPLAQCGVSLHADMAVVNIAPGCQYFLADKKEVGKSLRCSFCTYGAPDMRAINLGQDLWQVELPAATYDKAKEALAAALAEGGISHIYLVGGSLTDWAQEGARFVEIARQLQEVVQRRVPMTCGSGALPDDVIETLHREDLVQNVSFNLEIWSKPLFQKICPGKDRFVGYDRWIASLEKAVSVFGRGRVYSAMVAGIELEPEHEMSHEAAVELALEGAEALCSRGVIPIYSLYWPVGGRNHPDYLRNLRQYFEWLSNGYADIRARHKLHFNPDFMCRKCAYMQVECDIDDARVRESADA
ncbi:MULTISPECIES: radical SAM protein [unclassified Marinovum]